MPDGSLLVTERPSRLRRIRNGQLEPAPTPSVPEVLALGQGGLLDVALHPRFAENQLVYFTYAAGDRQANRTRVARARFDGNALQAWEDIFEVPQAKSGGQHFGARLAWLPDETLLVSIGDGGNPPVRLEGGWIREQAQNLASYLQGGAEVLETIEVGERVRDGRQGPDGLVYVLTDDPNGQLLRLEPR